MRYFLEVSYKGTGFSGFQLQHNANTIQAEVEKAFTILLKEKVVMTGSSRTDAGVHALQNFFHFDFDSKIDSAILYNVNAILPAGLVAKSVIPVSEQSHCRFDALSRGYKYFVYWEKNPFLDDRAYYFPYKLDLEILSKAAEIIKEVTDFTSFSKRNTQVKSFNCSIIESEWILEADYLVYRIKANRFLRGMVRALVATMLKIGRGNLSIDEFRKIIESRDCALTSFAVPPQGLFLMRVEFPEGYFTQ